MSMNLARQDFATTPEHLIAGVSIGITTGIKTAAAAVEKGAPVLLDNSGKVKPVTGTASSVTTTGLYGIAAASAAKDEEAVIYLTGEFFADGLVLEENVTAAALEVPFRNIGIFLK